MQIVFSDPKLGKTAQLEVQKEAEARLIGSKIGDVIDGSPAGLDGFKLKITGMSDSSGAPSRSEIDGIGKSRSLLRFGTGMRVRSKGYRAKKLVRGNTISTDTVQINTVIAEYGQKSAEELFKPKEKPAE